MFECSTFAINFVIFLGKIHNQLQAVAEETVLEGRTSPPNTPTLGLDFI